ncbi:DUF5305 domain-containing protein [Halodesulfurarchaeum sp.]|uniref:DUF5305 domain-containing protein n=1 Tax=Halodesulfurarchaeum sp. TaxID=1980530 RepID=UPI002FC37A0F
MFDNPRVKLFIANHRRKLLIGMAVAGLIALTVAAGIALNPPTTTATETRDQQSIATTGAMNASVVDGGEWDNLSPNRETFLLESSPSIDFEARTTGPDGTTVAHVVTLQIEGTRDDDVFWYEEEVLLEEELTVENGEADASVSVNVSEVGQRLSTVRNRLAGVGSVQSRVHLRTEYDTGTYQGELTSTSVLTVTNRAYWLESKLSDTATRDTTVQVERTESPNWPAVSLIGLVGLLLLTGAVRIRTVDPKDLDMSALRQRVHRNRYADWISSGSVQTSEGKDYIEMDLLEDLVDVAIDTNERVVYDEEQDLFAVIEENSVYYYSNSSD